MPGPFAPRLPVFRATFLAVTLLTGSPVLALETSSTATTSAQQQGVFFPETFTLDNGMQVVVVTNRRVPLVTQMVWYRVGAADEPVGKSGIAHFLEHLMFKGTDELAPGEFSKIVARHGGKDNAFTSQDYTAYHQTVARDRLEMVMKMEADRMTDLALTDDVIGPERDVIISERFQRTENDPGARLNEAVQSGLFVNHPYGKPVIGWESEMRTLNREDATSFYKHWYNPANAILVIAGDVNAAEVRPLAEKYFGPISGHAIAPRQRPASQPLEAERRVTLHDEQVSQPSLHRQYLAPSYNRGKTEYTYPLQVLAEIMGGGSTSRLYRSLVVDQQVAVSTGMSYSPSDMDLSTLSLWVMPAPDVELDTAEKALVAEIGKLLKEGVTPDEVTRAKTRLQRAAMFARDSATAPAYALGTALAIGQTIEDVESWPQRIATVTPEQVNAAARDILSQTGHITGILLPKDAPEQAAVSGVVTQ